MTSKYKNIAFILGLGMSLGLASCSDSYMEDINTNDTKTVALDPNAQLTTSLLQTYGDFGMMDTYRSYITGFTQHFAGGWNVSNYAGSVHYNDDQSRLVWDKLYSVSIKNLNDAILNSEEGSNVNAALRIHKVYLMSVLTDFYGDVPCKEAGWTGLKKAPADSINYATPRYDTQDSIYYWFFDELKACVAQLDANGDVISGDVTSLGGSADAWKKYANSLRMRFAMRISDVEPQKAQKEFELAVSSGNYIESAADDAYIIYQDSPFTLYDGANDMDFRANSLGAILYGQDPTSPTFVCSTLYNILNDNNDPRLNAICRHYINTTRSEVKPDVQGNVDLTDEVRLYLTNTSKKVEPCKPGAAWWNNWVSAPPTSSIPTLARMVAQNPTAGYDQSNFPARMMRPFLSIDFEMPNRPGYLFSSAEMNFLLSEAISKGWNVRGDAKVYFEAGIRAAMAMLNQHYLSSSRQLKDELIDDYINGLTVDFSQYDKADPSDETVYAREAINTQAWILHMMNPNEAWSNLRRSDYPVLTDRAKLPKFLSDFTYDDDNLTIPTRLRYPKLEGKYNSVNYEEAIKRMGSDDWHARVWWDIADINVK